MNINQDIDKSQWWMINKLKRESILFNSDSFTIDVQEKNDKYSRKQQQKLLEKLTNIGAMRCKPIRTNLDDYAVSSGQQEIWDTRNYRVTLIQPTFDDLYSQYEKTHPYSSLETIDKTVRYKTGTITQGNAQHTFKEPPEMASILSLIWQKRGIKVDDKLEKIGNPIDIDALKNNLLDIKPGISPERITSLCKSFNKAMGRKHIGAKITFRGGVLLTVDQSTGQ